MPVATSFGIAETDNYVRNILSRAGTPPKGADPDQTVDWLLPSVIHQESRGNPNAVSSKGALGRLQVMPATAANPGFGIAPAKDHSPEELERVGKAYLKAMVQRYPGRPDLALAAYNAGPGRADKWAGIDVMRGVADRAAEEGGPVPFRGAANGFDRTTLLAGPDLGELPTVDRSRPEASLKDYFDDIVGVDSSIAAYHNMAEDAGFTPEEGFDIGAIPSDEWKKITQGIPEEFQEGLGNAVSMAHLQTLAARARATLQAEQEIAEFGGWGIAGRFALNMLDPLSLAVGYASGGLGALTKAARLAKAAKAATAAGRLTEAATAVEALGAVGRSGAWKNAGKVALAAGTENAALEGILDQGNITRDGWDVAFAGLTGAALGASFSRVFRGRELREINTAYLRAREELKIAELNHTIGLRQQEIDLKMKWLHADGDVAQARRQLSELEAKQATDRAEHQKLLEANRRTRQDYLSKLSAKRREALEPAIERGRNAEVHRVQLESRIDKARQTVEELRERVEGGDTSQATTKSLAAATRQLKELERLHKNHVERTAKQVAAGQKAEAELARRGIPTAAEDAAALQAFEARQGKERAAVEGRLRDAEGAVEARRQKLLADQAELAKLRESGVAAIDQLTAKDAAALNVFGKDTASAARFDGFKEPVHAEHEDSGLPSANPVARMGSSLGGFRDKLTQLGIMRKGPFATFAMVLRGSPDAAVRDNLGRLVANNIGTVDGTANTIGASEITHVYRQKMEAAFNTVVTPTYLEWRRKNSIGMMQGNTRKARDMFMRDVGRAVLGDTSVDDPSILKAASGMRKIYRQYLTDLKEAGVKGLENVDPRDDYLPAVFDFHRLHTIEGQIGTGNLRNLVAGAVRAADPDVSAKTAEKIAKAYVTTMKKLRVGADPGLINGVRWDDVGFLRQFLTDAKLPSDEIEEVISEFAALNARRNRQTEGDVRYAKHRVQMDQNFQMTFKDQAAMRAGRDENVTVKVSDLFETNVEALFGRYNRTMAGHLGLAKVGIKSKKDFEDSIARVENALEDNEPELRRVKKFANAAYSLITGTPIEEASDLTRIGRAMRDWNFTTTMGQSGWAQLPDIAGLLQKGYLGHTLKHFPEIFHTIRRTDGSIDVDFYRELEEWTGLGTDLFNNKIFSSFDWGDEGEGLSGLAGKAEHAIRVAGRGVQKASGLSFMTEMSQRMAGRAIIQRLVSDVLVDGNMAEHRALALGLDGPMKARIAAQLKAHTDFVDGDFGGTVRRVNYAGWDDIEARDSFLYAVSKEARRLVQEEDLGDTTLWMHTHLGKVVAQFRRFALVSYSRQLLHGIAHADAEEFTRVMVSMALAAAAYKARHETNLALKEAAGMSPEDAQEYRENYLSLDRLAAASWANSSYASVLPGLWDTAQSTLTGTRTFDTRTSGLGSDLITGNPTYSTLTGLGRAVSGSAQSLIRGDRQFDQKDAAAWRRITPFGNVLGMDLPFAALTANLPEGDHDPDPEDLDWLFDDNPQ